MVQDHEEKIKNLAVKLFEIEAFKFGEFTLKSGQKSPVYFDLRVIISFPEVMNTLSELLVDFSKQLGLQYDHVCGVPYTALPIATLVSIKESRPMLIRRKETKSYGTKKLIEGRFGAGESCLIIEDVITTGSSILETVEDLRKEGIVVNDAVVVVNREQGADANIAKSNVKVHSLFNLSFLLEVLRDAGKIEQSMVDAVSAFVAASQTVAKDPTPIVSERTSLSYAARSHLAASPVAQKLFNLMATKQTNLCVAADLTIAQQILDLADSIGPHICLLKTHIDIVQDFTPAFIASLQSLATKHNFLLMEDRKFADIGNTVALQYADGVYNISGWADLVTAHSLPGAGIIKGLQSVLKDASVERGVFLLAELSCAGNLINAKYTEDTIALAAASGSFVAGIVCQTKSVVTDVGLIQLTPGVRIDDRSDELGQQYDTPEYVIGEKGADIAVVGRGVIGAKNPEAAAKLYRDRLWAAYEQRLGKQ